MVDRKEFKHVHPMSNDILPKEQYYTNPNRKETRDERVEWHMPQKTPVYRCYVLNWRQIIIRKHLEKTLEKRIRLTFLCKCFNRRRPRLLKCIFKFICISVARRPANSIRMRSVPNYRAKKIFYWERKIKMCSRPQHQEEINPYTLIKTQKEPTHFSLTSFIST